MHQLASKNKLYAPSIITTEIVRVYCKEWQKRGRDPLKLQTLNVAFRSLQGLIGHINLLPIAQTRGLNEHAQTILIDAAAGGHLLQTWDVYYIAACFIFSNYGPNDGVLLTVDQGLRDVARNVFNLRIYPTHTLKETGRK